MTNGDILGIAFDAENGKVYFRKVDLCNNG